MALTPTHLRLEAPDGCAEEYRIRDEHIEIRQLQDDPTKDDRPWHQLTPEQLTDHVERKTAVAHWLERRLGWRRLLQACLGEQTLYSFGTEENTAERRAAAGGRC